MKKHLYIAALILASGVQAQEALYNTGNLRIHEGGVMGFHTDLINDGSFDENLGLVGFYGDNLRSISGSFPATLYDVEFVTGSGTVLQNALNVLNNANFVTGDVITDRAQPALSLNFLANAFPNGQSNISKVNGYASVNDQQNFIFPVGDDAQLRPLILSSEGINTLARCAYFIEDANNPTTLPGSYNTNNKDTQIGDISIIEFWHLEGSVPSSIQLSWNERSNIGLLTSDVNEVAIVGYSKATNRWESLNGSAPAGDLNEGVVASGSFIPDDYEVLTFAAMGEPRDFLKLENYFVSPNGDGINDFLEIPELALSPNNFVQIYNREGLKVFEKQNYTNEFNGLSTQNNFVITRDQGLPSGVYFYIVTLDDLDLEFQGFLYLAND
ncbi:gliding motility-associated C-terminal domain-containing protein [Zobellia barbeyronii]|uniref:Gliding motility-associated C-terminal domain-containing protein n=1 Tax=Zobellia barbeyronii TaxID=2748009 RepID=A0ABS5WI69_9FLAO|nr:gliding motility-associated C-terminal domain-containing protein [Zobellia barbeyronii]MBT2161887.1 gliding motility-associated C-terminal domain-containing protein [Zobellia barbeyronii]